jgi:type I restriction enzyme S subunit
VHNYYQSEFLVSKYLLLSIKPRIIEEIVSGAKKFEFRKKLPDLRNIELGIEKIILIYSSTPEQKIFGSFKARNFFVEKFDVLMDEIGATEAYKERIFNYIQHKDVCYALEISELNFYKKPLSLSHLRDNHNNFYPGQSYRYLEKDGSVIKDIVEQNGTL